MKIDLDSDEVSKVVAESMRELIEIMSTDPIIPFVSHNIKEEMKYRKKMTKAAKRILKWHTVPSEWNEERDEGLDD